ncbi:uncharacterized protein [Argopecten irradians]|uniref:uncharacterized protein n=1 Tax=Argopecten irradians TaxID=31199 RepID=UPI003711BA2F
MTDGSSQQASEESQYAALHQGINRQFRSKTSLSSISTGYLGSLEETDTSSNSQLSGRSSSDFLGCFDLQPNLPSPLFDKLFQSVSVLDPSSFQGHEQEFLDSSSSNLDSKSDNMRNSETDSSKREVFLPEDEEEFPFSRYTFNKKPGKEVMCTSSGQSSSSLSSISSDSSLPQERHSSLSSCQSYSSLFTGCSVIPDMNDPHNFPMNRHPPVPAHLPQGDITGSGLSYHSEELMSHGETASDMLFNLGFGGVDSFLPDRFARDWCQKIQKAHQERMDQHRLQLSYQQICPDQKTLVSGSTEPNINRESQANSSDKVCASGQQGPSQRTSTTLQKLHQLLQPSNLSSQGARDTRSWDGNHNIQAQEEIGAMDNNLIREKRRKQFLTNKQNALLAYLETLEEDEKMLHTRYRVLPSATQNRGNKLPTIDHSDTNSSNSGQQDSEEDTMEVFYNFQQNGIENSDPDHLTQSSIHQENLNSEINIGHGTISDRGCTQEQFGSHPDEDDVFNNDKDLACQLDRPRKQLEAPGILQDFPQTKNSKTLKHKDEQNQYPNEVIPGKGHQRDRLEGQSSLGNVIVPSIQIGPTTQDTRTDSMEVAEILVQTLNNANDTAQKQSKMAKLLCVNTSDDRMLSSLSGSSSSPAVFSPVTVIEVNLDNQNDVMENEEGSKTFINQNGFSSTMSQDSDPGSYDRSDTGLRRKSFIDALVYDNCSDRVKKFDTRRLSLNLNCENAYGEHHNLNTMIHSIKQTETQDATLMKSNAVKSAANVKEKMCEQEKLGENQKSKDSNDVCIQADDGRLSPLVRQADLEKLLKCLEVHDGSESSYYLAQDRGTQWISSDLSEDSDLKEGTKGTGRSHGDVRHNPIRSADIQDKFPERGSRCNHHKSYSSKTDIRETLSPTYNPNLSINSDQKDRKPFYRDLHVSMDTDQKDRQSFARDLHVSMDTDQKDRQPFARDLHVSMDTDQKDRQPFARDLHVSMDTDQKDRQPFARDLHVSMDTDQKKPNLQYNSDSALLNRKSGKIGENKRDKIRLGHASHCPSQVTIVTRGDHSYKSDSESSGSSESSYPLYNSQTMRKIFSSQKCGSIDICTFNHGTQT